MELAVTACWRRCIATKSHQILCATKKGSLGHDETRSAPLGKGRKDKEVSAQYLKDTKGENTGEGKQWCRDFHPLNILMVGELFCGKVQLGLDKPLKL